MNTLEVLNLQALKLKELQTRGVSDDRLIDHFIDSNESAAKEQMRNICAFISTELFTEVEGICSVLSISKRRLVEMALIDIIEKANSVMDEVSPFPEEKASC